VEAISAADKDYFSCKIVNTHKNNPNCYGSPTIVVNGIFVDGKTGYPLLITGSTVLTALRKGVASAITTSYLAKKKRQNLGIIGNVAQSFPQLHATGLVRDIENVFVFDTDIQASHSPKKCASKLFKNMNVEIMSNPHNVSYKSDIVVTTTCKD
jgi:ornithine cyclodeaminase/alanine dehydrogenase-like protein (mu-crystallin family)